MPPTATATAIAATAATTTTTSSRRLTPEVAEHVRQVAQALQWLNGASAVLVDACDFVRRLDMAGVQLGPPEPADDGQGGDAIDRAYRRMRRRGLLPSTTGHAAGHGGVEVRGQIENEGAASVAVGTVADEASDGELTEADVEQVALLKRLHALPGTAKLTETEAAAYLNCRKELLRTWRWQRKGPAWQGSGRLTRYLKSELDRYMSGG